MLRVGESPGPAGYSELETTVEVVEVGRPFVAYRYDERQRGLVAERVESGTRDLEVDRAVVPRALGEDGRPLEVWLLGELSPMPGVRARVRLLGVAGTINNPAMALLGVLAGDEGLEGVRDATALPKEHRARLPILEGELVLQGLEAARMVLHEAQSRAVRVAQEAHKGGRGPVWQAPALRGTGAGATDAHTVAERQVLLLPFRFQEYVARCLRPDERVLLYVTRPAMADPASRLRLLGGRRLHEGLLVVTDQQLLFMEDVLAPDQTMVAWGYTATTAPLARLAEVHMDEHGETASLAVVVQAEDGQHRWTIAFPRDRAVWLRETTTLLGAFTRREGVLLPARRFVPGPSDGLVGEGLDEDGRKVLDVLRKELCGMLPEPQLVLGEALAPGRTYTSEPHRLVATTADALWIVTQGGGPQRYALSGIAMLELRHSVLGSHLRVSLPGRRGLEQVTIQLEARVVDDFLRLFLVLRQLISVPVAGRDG